LIILDTEISDGNYCDIITQIRLSNKDAFIIIFSAFSKVSCAVKAIKHNVNGLLQKGSSGSELIEAVEKIITEHTYIHSDIAAKIAAHLDKNNNLFLHEKLSAREFEIFVLIAQGYTIKGIAQMLQLSEKTIGSHLTRTREKTGLTSLVHITRYAFRCGLVT
jgi:two-component system invasion response regulator UvrY